MSVANRRANPRPGGFTLVELLVVIAIIGLISAAALPVILPALSERRVSEAARILQANLAGARDAAIRANAPRGLRFLPDPGFSFANNVGQGLPLASNRFVPIEPAPDYYEGVVHGSIASPSGLTSSVGGQYPTYLRVVASEFSFLGTVPIVNAPTGWQFNIRQGDRIRFNDSGNYYKVAGPIHGLAAGQNPERYIAYRPLADECPPKANTTGFADYWTYLDLTTNPGTYKTQLYSSYNSNLPIEYLNLTNGIDDDGDGWIDESCDGIDNDGDGIIDPGFNGIDDDGQNGIDDPAEMMFGMLPGVNPGDPPYFSKTAGSEYEPESFVGVQTADTLTNANYIISRRPVVSPNSAETTLPAGVVIDLTTWNAAASISAKDGTATPTAPERSRLPVDPFSGYVDILVDQTGRVVNPGAGSASASALTPLNSLPFYHFWLTDREGVIAPLWGSSSGTSAPAVPFANPNYGTTATSNTFLLPMPQETAGYPIAGHPTDSLKGERRLVTLFTKTGQIVSNSITNFNVYNTNYPFYEAQSGVKESQ